MKLEQKQVHIVDRLYVCNRLDVTLDAGIRCRHPTNLTWRELGEMGNQSKGDRWPA